MRSVGIYIEDIDSEENNDDEDHLLVDELDNDDEDEDEDDAAAADIALSILNANDLIDVEDD